MPVLQGGNPRRHHGGSYLNNAINASACRPNYQPLGVLCQGYNPLLLGDQALEQARRSLRDYLEGAVVVWFVLGPLCILLMLAGGALWVCWTNIRLEQMPYRRLAAAQPSLMPKPVDAARRDSQP